MAETIGSLADKLTIAELKIYHMREQSLRKDAFAGFKKECKDRIKALCRQRDDLVEELNQLFHDVLAGRRQLKVYRQFKMYNDPKYRSHRKNSS